MIAKLLSPVLSVITVFLILALDHIWRDKRAKSYKRIRMIVLAVMAISLFVNVAIVLDSEQKVASLENQNKELSLLERMQRFITTDYDALSRKYPKGYFLFANNKYTVIPSNKDIKSSFTLDWTGSKVRFMDENFVYITLKQFHYYPNEIRIEDLNIVVRKRVGATADGIMFDGVRDLLYIWFSDEERKSLETFPIKTVGRIRTEGRNGKDGCSVMQAGYRHWDLFRSPHCNKPRKLMGSCHRTFDQAGIATQLVTRGSLRDIH